MSPHWQFKLLFYNVPQIVLFKHCIWFPKPPWACHNICLHPWYEAFIEQSVSGVFFLFSFCACMFLKQPNNVTQGSAFVKIDSNQLFQGIVHATLNMVAVNCCLACLCSHCGCSGEVFVLVPLIAKGEDVYSACINMRHIAMCLNASPQFFITQNGWIAVIVFIFISS